MIAATLAGSAIALSAGAAHAADVVDPDDTTFVPTTADVIGVGSDTSQHAVKLFADAVNASGKAPFKVATYAATGGGNIPLPSKAIARPNGSGAGKALLYGAGNNTDVDFARSSSANSTAETSAGLQAFPFALDTLVMAVSGSTPSHAPTALTGAQIVSIYKGDTTDWSQIGGTAGVIAPKIPQAGSGTRSFFVAQLKALNGGVDVTLGKNVAEVQEHDDSAIKNDANAIAPFSKGRAGLLGTTLHLETGFSADRALYNVVRGADLSSTWAQGLFGVDGALCSTDVRPLIEAAGFQQLATPDNGGVCGQATQSGVTNFAINQQIVTTTSVKATSPKAKSATIVATVSGSTSPSGTVDFFEGDTKVASAVPLVSGQATATLTGVTPGEHTYTAEFVPASGTKFDPSTGDATLTVKTGSKLAESFPATVAKGAKAKGSVTVTADGATATGTVKIMKGSKTLGTAKLKNGVATFTLKLSKGKNSLKAVYAGDDQVAGSSKSFSIKQK
ncbi:Ig-like domain repeat protein [Nocardioides sp. CN2-186]|uniref:Ig-like domain repeat protein n=1 Tax=Nocardioides tweenelious TaxID=3156607 RepID=UPI0032B422E0